MMEKRSRQVMSSGKYLHANTPSQIVEQIAGNNSAKLCMLTHAAAYLWHI